MKQEHNKIIPKNLEQAAQTANKDVVKDFLAQAFQEAMLRNPEINDKLKELFNKIVKQ